MPVRATIVALLTLAALLLVVPANAAITCTYDAPTATVSLALDNGDVATVVRSGDAITVNGTPCDIATVMNVDTIQVASTGTSAEVDIDLSGGAFAPGQTPESDGVDSEIEWQVSLLAGSTLKVLGSANADHVVLGAGGINLNADEATGDADITITGSPTIVLDGMAGDDVLSVGGGLGTGAAGPIATVLGGDGDDRLVPGAFGSSFDGGNGNDAIDYSNTTGPIDADLSAGTVAVGGVTDTVAAIESITGTAAGDHIVGDENANAIDAGAGDDTVDGRGGDDTLDGGDGTDTLDMSTAASAAVNLATGVAAGDGNDTVSAFENVIGSPGSDKLVGDDSPNTLSGLAGDDTITGGKGSDDLKGGTGTDTLSYAGSPDGVTIDLRDGTSTGLGADTLTGFEDIAGSSKADTIHGDDHKNRIDGGAGADEIYGHGGIDHLIGGNSNDYLAGQKGDDLLLGGAGNDQLDGGQGNGDICRGANGADAFAECEKMSAS